MTNDYQIISALNILKIRSENVSREEVKRAYRTLCHKYHPDQYETKNETVKDTMQKKYMQIKNAYEFLMAINETEITNAITRYKMQCNQSNLKQNIVPIVSYKKREAKIFSSNREAARQNKLQKAFSADKKKNKDYMTRRTEKPNVSKVYEENSYEDALKKISAIWIAELIHKQIEEDKKKKEKENRDKLYRAFMQYEQNRTNE